MTEIIYSPSTKRALADLDFDWGVKASCCLVVGVGLGLTFAALAMGAFI